MSSPFAALVGSFTDLMSLRALDVLVISYHAYLRSFGS
jgi:hypothetical protein